MKYPINVVPLHDCVPLVDSSQKNSFISLFEAWNVAKGHKVQGGRILSQGTVCIYIYDNLKEVEFWSNSNWIFHIPDPYFRVKRNVDTSKKKKGENQCAWEPPPSELHIFAHVNYLFIYWNAWIASFSLYDL